MTTHQRILDANPELLELSFGCKINIGEGHFAGSKGISPSQNPLTILTVTTDPNVFLVMTRIGIEHFRWTDIDQFCKILGHPIQLQHVLKAMISKDGVMNDDNLVEVIARWNLSLSWDNQEQRVKDFVGSLLDK